MDKGNDIKGKGKAIEGSGDRSRSPSSEKRSGLYEGYSGYDNLERGAMNSSLIRSETSNIPDPISSDTDLSKDPNYLLLAKEYEQEHSGNKELETARTLSREYNMHQASSSRAGDTQYDYEQLQLALAMSLEETIPVPNPTRLGDIQEEIAMQAMLEASKHNK